MATKKNDETPDLNALLDNPVVADVEPAKTPEQEELERLRAELKAEETRAAAHPTDGSGKPLSEDQLTPEQREIRVLEDRLAAKKAQNFLSAPAEFESADGSEVTIHFVEDGLTAQGRTWLTGQTLSFGPEAYEQTKDRYGDSWVDQDESAQWRRYGKVYFRRGPWRGATYDDEVAKEDARRGTAAPLINL